MSLPTQKQVALEAAKYAVGQFPALDSWLSHEQELADEWLKNSEFCCTVDYAIQKVSDRIRWSKQMQSYASRVGGGAKGIALVAGMVVGEWTGGHTTINRELDSWG